MRRGPPSHGVGDLVERYRAVLAQLWLLGLPSDSRSPHAHQADLADARHLLAEQARLCDELGPEFASAVSRQHAREWATLMMCDIAQDPRGPSRATDRRELDPCTGSNTPN